MLNRCNCTFTEVSVYSDVSNVIHLILNSTSKQFLKIKINERHDARTHVHPSVEVFVGCLQKTGAPRGPRGGVEEEVAPPGLH